MAPDWPDPAYRHLTRELLASISADEIGSVVAQHVALRAAEVGGDYGAVIPTLPSGTRAVYATWIVDGEVNNGGFNQFFFNHGGLAGVALAGYELLGAEEYAAVMRAAIATHETERHVMDRFHEARTLEAFSESYKHTTLGEVDQQYYALGDGIYHIWATIVHDRPELFVG